jgi:hypothetical protein
MNSRGSGRHRVADGAIAETTGSSMGRVEPLMADQVGPFTVQYLGDSWFVGAPGAAQRIEDRAGLEAWLAVNGCLSDDELDFVGGSELRQRFLAELGAGTPHPTDRSERKEGVR